jgi:16S rRNA (uracil1498-N3)-methyltransferase
LRLNVDRFYSPSLTNTPVELRDEEFHHLAHVLRKRVGDRVALFDGRGRAAAGVIEALGKRDARIRIEQLHPPESDSRVTIAFATPVPKGDRAKWLVEKLTELGVDVWTPLQTGRSVVDPGFTRLEKLQQSVIAACKQCGRNRLLEIEPLTTWESWVGREQAVGPILVADPQGEPINVVLERLTDRPAPWVRLHAAVGPEGGFAPEELDLARQSGAVLVNLGTTILRIETAAIALAAILRLR